MQGINTLAWLEKRNDIKYEAPPPPIQPTLLDGIVGPEELMKYEVDPKLYDPMDRD